jgi:GNAT superfamily N-acetyltransferase
LITGAAGVVITLDWQPHVVMAFTIVNDQFVEIDVIADPERVRRVASPVLGGSHRGGRGFGRGGNRPQTSCGHHTSAIVGTPRRMEYSGVGNDQFKRSVRPARPDEFAQLREIELKADQLFEAVGIGPFVNDEAENHFDLAVLVLAVNDPPEGFVCVELVDGIPHIWQLSVDPDQGRQGLGRALVTAACDWARSEGFGAITLTTYRDVPWNGPFYESLGFVVLEVLTPELTAIREHERAIGDDDFGPRVAMRLDL